MFEGGKPMFRGPPGGSLEMVVGKRRRRRRAEEEEEEDFMSNVELAAPRMPSHYAADHVSVPFFIRMVVQPNQCR